MFDGDALATMAARLVLIEGVEGVVLGGSRARGAQGADSDVDLGIDVAGELDEDALRDLATRLSEQPASWSGAGGWGTWVDGGAWLVVDGVRVDWIRRESLAWTRTGSGHCAVSMRSTPKQAIPWASSTSATAPSSRSAASSLILGAASRLVRRR